MTPRINQTEFGSITIEGKVFEHDVVIQPNGKVRKRKNKLSKSVYGSSHIISLDEAKHISGETQHKRIRCEGKQPFHLTALFTDLCKYWIMREGRKIHPLYGFLGSLPFIQ